MVLVSWFSYLTNGVITSPLKILSQTKWQSTSMCLILSWNTGLEAICIAAWLSQDSWIGVVTVKLNFWRNCCNNIKLTSSMCRCSVICFYTWSSNYILFLAFPRHKISSQKSAKYPVVDLLSDDDPIQYGSIWLSTRLPNNPAPQGYQVHTSFKINRFLVWISAPQFPGSSRVCQDLKFENVLRMVSIWTKQAFCFNLD